MKTLFTSIKMPYTRVGVLSVSINKIEICYRENHFLCLVEGGDNADNGADARGTIVSLLKEGDDEFAFGFELALNFYNDHISQGVKSEIRDFLQKCLNDAAGGVEVDWEE